MGKIYDDADAATYAIVDGVMRQYHNELHSLNVVVAVTTVTKLGPEDEKIPCLKHHGAFATAVVRLIRASQRVRVKHDVEIMVDLYRWEEATAAMQAAIIDHELEHIEVCKDSKNQVKTDDRGRPKLRLKPDDYSLTGFFINIQRHGVNSPEWPSIDKVFQKAEAALDAHRNPRPVDPQPVEAAAPPVIPLPETQFMEAEDTTTAEVPA